MSDRDATDELSRSKRNWLSLLLLFHLVCIFAVLSANSNPSQLQLRIKQVLAPYTQTLNFDPDFLPYHLTSGDPGEGDHYVEIAAADDSQLIAQLPAPGRAIGLRHRRYVTLAQFMGFYATAEADELTAELAASIGQHFLEQPHASTIDNASADQRIVVRVRRRRSIDAPDYDASGEPFAQSNFETVYEADVWLENGEALVHKRVAEDEAARVVPGA